MAKNHELKAFICLRQPSKICRGHMAFFLDYFENVECTTANVKSLFRWLQDKFSKTSKDSQNAIKTGETALPQVVKLVKSGIAGCKEDGVHE
jgi:hypothetical protein